MEAKLSSKKAASLLAVALGISLVGATVLHVLINPESIYSTANAQVLKATTASREPTIISGNYVSVNKQVNPRDLSVNYPNSDIIVFRKPSEPKPTRCSQNS
jgi:hypothetical protein